MNKKKPLHTWYENPVKHHLVLEKTMDPQKFKVHPKLKRRLMVSRAVLTHIKKRRLPQAPHFLTELRAPFLQKYT